MKKVKIINNIIVVVLLYMAVTGLFSSIKLLYSGFVFSGVLTILFCIAGVVSSLGICFAKRWAFYAFCVWLELLLYRLVNAFSILKIYGEFSVNSLLVVMAICIILSTLAMSHMHVCYNSGSKKEKWQRKYSKEFFIAVILFYPEALLSFFVTIFFVTNDLLSVIMVSLLLDIPVVFFLWSYLFSAWENKEIVLFLISSFSFLFVLMFFWINIS